MIIFPICNYVYVMISNYKTAKYYNELAGKCKPNDPSYLHNKLYFNRIENDE